jgi:hypothetical protein
VLRIIDGLSVLTVSDMPGFVEQAGMIELVSQGNRVRFAG